MKTLILALFAFFIPSFATAEVPAEIIDPQLIIREASEETHIFTLGIVRNHGEYPLMDVMLEIRYFDPEGKMIDTASMGLYSTVIQPGDTAAFKAQSLAIKNASKYASQEIKVVSGYVDRPIISEPKSKAEPPNKWANIGLNLLISSFPILLLIAVWIYYIRKISGKNSHQCQTMELFQQQTELLQRQADALERLADSSNKSHGDR